MVDHLQIAAVYAIALLAAGWLFFSLTAGLMVYFSSFTRAMTTLEPKGIPGGKSGSVLQHHIRDPLIMDPLNAAKERWAVRRTNREIDELACISGDGLKLAGFFWKAAQDVTQTISETNSVILVHGITDSAAGMAYLAEEYHARGWNVLAIDQRAHGESGGTKRTLGVKEALDLDMWVSKLEDRYGASRVFLHGVSMGGAAVLLYGCSAAVRPVVKGIIADSAFARQSDVLYRLLYLVLHNRFLAWSILQGVSLSSLVLSGVSIPQMNTQKHLENSTIPVLLFHGEADKLVPIDYVRALLDLVVKRGGESVVIQGAPHIGSYFYASVLYMKKIEELSGRTT